MQRLMKERGLDAHGDKRWDALEAQFALLKHRLLLQRLNGTPEPDVHALIIQQADETALMAWVSSYPLLAFPCLFEERAAAVAERARLEGRRYWDGIGPQTARAA
jgi:hypothetical protein